MYVCTGKKKIIMTIQKRKENERINNKWFSNNETVEMVRERFVMLIDVNY